MSLDDIKQALRPYCVGGAYGRLLDAEAEHLGSADVQAFEIEGLIGTGAAPAVLHLPGYPEAAKAVHEWEKAVLPRSVPDPEAGLRSATRTSKGAELTRTVGDAVGAIVFGRKPLSAWKDAVAQWRQAGGDKVAEELAKEYAAAK